MASQRFCPIFLLLIVFFLIIILGLTETVEIQSGCPYNHFSSESMEEARQKLIYDRSGAEEQEPSALRQELMAQLENQRGEIQDW